MDRDRDTVMLIVYTPTLVLAPCHEMSCNGPFLVSGWAVMAPPPCVRCQPEIRHQFLLHFIISLGGPNIRTTLVIVTQAQENRRKSREWLPPFSKSFTLFIVTKLVRHSKLIFYSASLCFVSNCHILWLTGDIHFTHTNYANIIQNYNNMLSASYTLLSISISDFFLFMHIDQNILPWPESPAPGPHPPVNICGQISELGPASAVCCCRREMEVGTLSSLSLPSLRLPLSLISRYLTLSPVRCEWWCSMTSNSLK